MLGETAGGEIWRDTAGQVDVLVVGVGSGAAITGIGRFLKAKKDTVRVRAR